MKNSIERIFSIAKYNSLPVFRNPLTFFTIVLWPVIPIFFLGVFMGIEGVKQGLIGMIVTSVSFSGIYVAQDYVFNRTISKLQDFLVASPVKQMEYILGISFGSLFFSIPSLFMGYIVLGYLGLSGIFSILLLTGSIFSGALILMPLGFVIGSRYDDVGRVNGITNLIAIVFSFLAPVYYPLDFVPDSFRIFTYIIPTTHVAHLARLSLGLTNFNGFGFYGHGVILLIFAFVLYGLGFKYSRWREV